MISIICIFTFNEKRVLNIEYATDINMAQILPIIDEHGILYINIPPLIFSEFSNPEEVHIQIRVTSAAIYFHYWLKLLTTQEAIVKLCILYSNLPIQCSNKNLIQYNYTHCIMDFGYISLSSYGKLCPVEEIRQSLNHEGTDLIFGADMLYKIFTDLDIHLEYISLD